MYGKKGKEEQRKQEMERKESVYGTLPTVLPGKEPICNDACISGHGSNHDQKVKKTLSSAALHLQK